MPGTILPNLHPPAVITGQVYWLLTVTHGSVIHRLSTATHNISEASTGQTHHYHGRLTGMDFGERSKFPQDIAEGVSIPIDAVFPDSIAELEGRGHRFGGSHAEVARWVAGTDFNERRIIATGLVSDPEFGSDDEPVSFSIESAIWKETVEVPAVGLRVNAINWSTVDTLDPAERGLAYPIIFGTPGKVSTNLVSRGWITGSQGCWVDRTSEVVLDPFAVGIEGLRVVLAGHPVRATRVYLSMDAVVAGERFVVLQGQDNRGNLVAYVDAAVIHTDSPGSGDFIIAGGDPDGNDSHGLGSLALDTAFQPNPYSSDPGVKPIFVGWYNDAQDVDGGEGGMVSQGGLVRDAGDVLETMIGYTGLPVDLGRFAAAKPYLSQFKIDCTIDARVKPWEWLKSNLLPILPVSIVTGPDGLYPIPWRFDAQPHDAIADLDTSKDPRIRRASRVRVDTSQIVNDFSIDFAKSIRTGSFYGTVRLNAEPYDSDDSDNLTSLHCRISQHRHRYRDGSPRIVEERLETVVVYDTATAHAILSWRARALALERRTISYVLPERDYATLQLGDVVTLTDAEVHITNQVCLVTGVETYDGDTIGIELLIVEDPARDNRLAA